MFQSGSEALFLDRFRGMAGSCHGAGNDED
jgi:hypothetical protein